MTPYLTIYDGQLLVNDAGTALQLSDSVIDPCCCGPCPCGINDSLSGAQLSVTGLLFGGNIVQSWSNIPFNTSVNGGCGQDQLAVGEYNAAALNAALAGARACTFDGIVIKAGAVACFFADAQQKTLSAIMIGPVIVNNINFQGSYISAGVILASGYTTHWANLGFANAAQYLKICAHNGNFSPNAPIVYKP